MSPPIPGSARSDSSRIDARIRWRSARKSGVSCERERPRPRQVDEHLVLEPAGAVGHHQDAVGDVDGLLHVMGHEQDREPVRLPDAGEQLLHQEPRLRVERPERLVHEQDPGPVAERPGDGHALLHPARELPRVRVGERGRGPRARGAPRRCAALLVALIRSPSSANSTFWRAVSHGNSVYVWNTTPRSRPGPVDRRVRRRRPRRRSARRGRRRCPAAWTCRSRDVPTSDTNSFSASVQVTPATAPRPAACPSNVLASQPADASAGRAPDRPCDHVGPVIARPTRNIQRPTPSSPGP